MSRWGGQGRKGGWVPGAAAEAAVPAGGAHCVLCVFAVPRCATPAHDKWICTDPGESSPAPGRLEGLGRAGGARGCSWLSLDAQVPRARLAQPYCCLLLIAACF